MANNPMQQFTVHKIGPEIKIAGIDGIVLTKLDVLDQLDEIKMCIAYEVGNKKMFEWMLIAERWTEQNAKCNKHVQVDATKLGT